MVRKYFVPLFIFLFLKANFVYANPINSNSQVSATVGSNGFNSPSLVSPADNTLTNNPLLQFVWLRPTPDPLYLHHYDLYIDDVIFAASIPDSLTTQDYYFYTASASGNYFNVYLKQNLSEGYHTWKVAVYDSFGQNATTGNWNFYIDSIAPFISLTKVESTVYSWDTATPESIPDENNRYISVDTSSPTLSGEVETNANLQITLICPSPTPLNCTTQNWITNSTDGKWTKQFTELVANLPYTVNISATDATNNSTVFPTFYVTYSLTTPEVTPTPTVTPKATPKPTITGEVSSPSATPTPSQEPLPTITATLTPPTELSSLITPTPFIAKTPPAPTPPPKKTTIPKPSKGFGVFILFLLLCLGLPTHLLLVTLAVDAKLKNFLNFIFTLGFPFLKRKNNETLPFTYLELYDPNKLNKKVYSAFSDIKGSFFLPKNIPPKLLVTLNKQNYLWKSQIMSSLILQYTCLSPSPKRFLEPKDNLLNYFYSLKSIPLIVAILTSSVGLYFFPSSYLTIYLYLSLQYAFSEYAYPKMVS